MKPLIIISAIFISIFSFSCNKSSSDSAGASQNGQSGSLTRFVLADNYLYTISNDALSVYNVSNAANPVYKNTVHIGFSIQTIFAYQDKLFIGSSTDMYIYSIANPELPTKVSSVIYFVRGKDPVVARDSFAFSTVRNDFSSGGVLNCFNIKNISQPQVVNRIPMFNPYGLGLKGSVLYACEADSGIKVFNIANPYNPVLSTRIQFNESAYDVIVTNNILVCYIKGGVSFFDITNPVSPSFISTVKN